MSLILASAVGAQQLDWKELNRQASQLLEQGRYADAVPLAQQAAKVAVESFGSQSKESATTFHTLAVLYDHEGNYAEAESQAKQALAIDQSMGAPGEINTARDLDDLSNICDHWGKFDQAEKFARQALASDEKEPDEPNHLNVARDLDSLGSVLGDEGQFTASEPLFKQALETREKALGTNDPGVAGDLDYLAEVYEGEGRFFEAEPLLKRALAIREKVLGPQHSDVARALNNLGYLYCNLGRYAEAEPLYKQALAIEQGLGLENPQLAMQLNNLAQLYQAQGRYEEAEPLLKEAMAIAEKLEGPEHPDVATDLNNLAELYAQEGNYAQAEPLFKQVVAIVEKAFGPNNYVVVMAIRNLAVVYRDEGRDDESEALVKQSLEIEQKLGPDNPDLAFGLNALARLYDHQGKFADAEPLYEQALVIEQKAVGPDHPDLAEMLGNLGLVYEHEGNYPAAEPLYRRALAIDQKALGSDNPDVAKRLNNLAQLYFAWARPAEAEQEFAAGMGVVHSILLEQFSYMSEHDRLSFLGTVSDRFPVFYSFAAAYRRQSPELAGRMYDLLLWEKGMVASETTALERRIETTGSAQDKAAYEQLKAVRTQVSNLMYMPASSAAFQQQAIDKLEAQADTIEQQLARQSAAFAENRKENQATWEDVRAALRADEAAVEFARYPVFDGKKWTGAQQYAALVVRPQSRLPVYVLLGNAARLEPLSIEEYRRSVARPGRDEAVSAASDSAPHAALYDAFWKPLLPALGQAKVVYVAPDGALDQLALGVVPTPDGKLLMDHYDLRILDSTRDLVRAPQPLPVNTAVLVGDPRFYMPESMWAAALESFAQPPQGNGENGDPRGQAARPAAARAGLSPAKVSTEMGFDQNCDPPPQPGGTTCPLPGTRSEVTEMAAWLRQKQWNVRTYVGRQALEESVMTGLAHPRVLVLATHGFFFPSQQQMQQAVFGSTSTGASPAAVQDPMLLSGLLFAGVDRSRLGLPAPAGARNGVLTAYDASTLDLQGTELVVLSACQTGLGTVEAGEGVFGLRRAFEEAGAQAVLMSMWSVPADQTEQLMADFMRNWLGSGEAKPMDKHEALRLAQEKLRKQIRNQYGRDVPYYWGAWVLVGR